MRNFFGFIWGTWQRKFMLQPRRFFFWLLGANIGVVKIYGKVKVSGWYKNITIGDNCTINEGVFLNARGKITIGNNCRLSSHTKIYTGQLTIESPRVHLEKNTTIEDNVWIGSGAIILGGVTVGNNSIIGAGAVVTSDTKPNSFYAGNPAKFIKKL